MPYTYLIGWSNLQKYYYGVRFAVNAHPGDLWVSYFTSSKYVKRLREEFGEPDIIEIRKEFDCIHAARKWEAKVLRRLKVIGNKTWLNMHNSVAIDPDSFREDARKRMIESNPMKNSETAKKVGAILAIKTKANMMKLTQEERSVKFGNYKENNPFYGKKHTQDSIDRMAAKIAKSYLLFTPEGEKLEIQNLNRYCIENSLNRDALMESMKNGEPVKAPRSKRKPTVERFKTIGYSLVLID